MPRQLNLRQIEAFKAVIELGTVSRGAEALHISQPAMSKLISHLEADTGLALFDRVKGRLAPTEHAMRLYDEIDRIFVGVRQIESAVDAIRREEQGRLAIGVMPALSGSFIQRATTGFLKDRGNVFCSIHSNTSQWIVDALIRRKLDIGVVSANIKNPYVTLEPLMDHPSVCIMPIGHPLSEKKIIQPHDLNKTPFVAFEADNSARRIFETYKLDVPIVLVANVAPTLCEFVAAGLGISLVHPLWVSGLEHRLVVRPFEPETRSHFQLCRSAESRNTKLVEAFAGQLRSTADQISRSLLDSI